MGNEVFTSLNEHFTFPFEPYDYQVQAVADALEYDSVLLPLKVGRGKTALATWIGLWHSIHSGVHRLVLIVPASLVIQWTRWLESIRFSNGDKLDVLAYQGSPKKRESMDFDCDCIVMSHQIFVRDYRSRIGLELSWDPNIFVIYDESQDGLRKVGNKIWRFFNTFTRNKRTALLSGTPISSPMDSYAVVKLLSPEIYKSKRQFMNIHVAAEDYFGNVVEWKNLEFMEKALYAKAVHVPDSAIAALPGLMIDLVQYELNPGHQKLYDQLVSEEMLKTDDGHILDATEAQRMFHTLQRFITSPDKLDISRVRANLFDALWTVYKEDDSKLIVFSNYKNTNQGVLEFFEKKKIPAVGAWGEFSRAQQQRSKDAFINDDSIRVMVGNPKSLGVGTDGLQSVCYREVFTELPLTPPQFEQATGRVYRTGQSEICVVKCLIALETIQENLYYALLNKDDLLDKIVRQKMSLREFLGG